MKKAKHAVIMTTVLMLAALAVLPALVSAAEFTDADATILKTSSDPDEVAGVLYKIQDIYETSGEAAIKAAVPGLIEAMHRELSIPEDERWNLVDIVKVMSLTGDERIKPELLTIMSVMWGGGNPFVAQGFLKLNSSVVSDIVDSLKSANLETRGRAALTLNKMDEYDETGKYFSEAQRETIRKALVENLASDNVNVRIYNVVALRGFGDESVIPQLEHIEKTDAHKDSGGTYEVRLEASETLKILRGEEN